MRILMLCGLTVATLLGGAMIGPDATVSRKAYAAPGDTRGSEPLKESLARARGQKPPLVSGKIFGGVDADWTKHKWQVALVRSEEPDNGQAQFCGGSLITASWVLTAAHCVDGGTLPEDIEVLGGTASLTGGGARTKVAKIFVHRRYEREIKNPYKPPHFDIALVRLAASATGEPIKPIAAAEESSFLISQTEASVTGWGLTETGKTSTNLKVTNVPIQTLRKCNGPASYDGLVTVEMFCAGRDAGGNDSCSGDSGGPITLRGRLIGVVSWGAGCGNPFKYGVYTNAARFSPWIDKCMTDEPNCEAK